MTSEPMTALHAGELDAAASALDASDPLRGFRERGVTVISLAKRIEEVFLPGQSEPVVLSHDTPELQLLQRVRDEAHRFAIEFHRGKRDKAMTGSVVDERGERALVSLSSSPRLPGWTTAKATLTSSSAWVIGGNGGMVCGGAGAGWVGTTRPVGRETTTGQRRSRGGASGRNRTDTPRGTGF